MVAARYARYYYHRVPAALFSPRLSGRRIRRVNRHFAFFITTPNLCRKLNSHKEMVKTTLFGPIVVNISKFYISENKDYDTTRKSDICSNCNVIHEHIMFNTWFIMNITINLKSCRSPDELDISYKPLYAHRALWQKALCASRFLIQGSRCAARILV